MKMSGRRVQLALLALVCLAASLVDATCDITQTGLHSRFAVRQYHINIRNYTSYLMSMPGVGGKFELGNGAFSAFGMTEIFNALYRESSGSMRRQLDGHPFLRHLPAVFFRKICGIVKENVIGSFCLGPRSSVAANDWISFTEVYLRRPNPFALVNTQEIENWEVITSGPRMSESGFASPLDRMLSARPIMGVNKLLHYLTDRERESMVAINVVNFRGLWKFETRDTEDNLMFRLSAKTTNNHFEMLPAIETLGMFRFLLCEVGGVYRCHRRGMPNIYEVPITSTSGQNFRLMIYQTTRDLTLEQIQEQFHIEGTRKWKLGKRSFLPQSARLVLPKTNMTTCYDLIDKMVAKGTDTHYVRESLDIYGTSGSNLVTYKATKLLAMSQFSISAAGISAGNSPTVAKRSAAPLVNRATLLRLTIDSPFLFAIEHVATESLVLAGRVVGSS